jgi:hypothetical protein
MRQLARAHDTLGMAQMEQAGQLYMIQDGTRARVIDPGFMVHEVRILEGTYAGRSGFIPVEFITAP